MIRQLFVLLALGLLCQAAKAQGFLGKWYTKTTLNGKEVHYHIDLRKNDHGYGGYIDLLSDKMFRIALDSVSYTNETLLVKDKGVDSHFSGSYNSQTEEIAGTLTKGEDSNSLVFYRQPQATRTQLIEEPAPYLSQDVYFYNQDSTRLAGTITYPKQGKNLKAVVLISGSGPQDRDEEILGHKPFKVLADHLSRNGIVVLRYDDRGYGESEGQFRPATSMDYAQDAQAAVNFLKDFKGAAIRSIGLIGHSEGGNIAPVVATQDTAIDFLVLLAAPAPSNLESYLVSLDLILKDSPETYDRDYALYKAVYEDMAHISDREVLKDSLKVKFADYATQLSKEEVAMYGGVDSFIQGQIAAHTSLWYHHYLQFKLSDYLEKLRIPVLALNGDKDTSVEADFNLKGMKDILDQAGNTEYELVKLKNVNHFFQVSEDDKIENVYFNQETFSEVALQKIGNWIIAL